MSRVEALTKLINKGIKVDEKSGEVIQGWSPNNIRRLVIGYDYAILQYHKTGGKFTGLIDTVNLSKAVNADVDKLRTSTQQEVSKMKSVLSILTQGRVCSNIEEIVFDQKDYPPVLLNIDLNFVGVLGNNLESRFPRLTSVSRVNLGREKMGEVIVNTKSDNLLLIDTLNASRTPLDSLYKAEGYFDGSWVTKSTTRPAIYPFDEILKKYFAGLTSTYQARVKEEKLAKLKEGSLENKAEKEKREIIVRINKEVVPFINALNIFLKTVERMDAIYTKAPFLSKGEWAKYYTEEKVYRIIAKELEMHHASTKEGSDSILTTFRRLDYEGLKKFILDYADDISPDGRVAANLAISLTHLEDILFSRVFKHKDHYKRDSNKATIRESAYIYGQALRFLFNTITNVVMFGYIKFLTRNTPKYAEDFYNQFNEKPGILAYSRAQVHFYNAHTKGSTSGDAKQALDLTMGMEILVEEFKPNTKVDTIDKVLKAFESLN